MPIYLNADPNNAAYWAQRSFESQKTAWQMEQATRKELTGLFKETFASIDKEKNAFYAKYGKIKASPTFTTLGDGTKVVSGTAKKLVVPMSSAQKSVAGITRLEQMEKQMKFHIKKLGVEQRKVITNVLSGVAENTYYHSMYDIAKGIGIGTQFSVLPRTTVLALINNPVHGHNFAERIGMNMTKFANAVNEELRTGIVQGLSTGEMSKRLAQKTGESAYNSNRLLRTEITNTYNQSALLSYENSKIVRWYQYLATLDKRTSSICQELDGETFNIENAVAGLNLPPMHVNCRSTTIPVFDRSHDKLTRMARDASGKTMTVPADMVFEQFMLSQVGKTKTAEIMALPQGYQPNTFVPYDVDTMLLPQNMEQMVEAFSKQYDSSGFTLPETSYDDGNLMLEELRAQKGFNGLPENIDRATFNALQDTGQKTVYRGVQGDKFCRAYTTGDHYAGYGIYGDGTYTAVNQQLARGYANSDFNVMSMIIDSKANIIEMDDLNKLRSAFKTKLKELQAKGQYKDGLTRTAARELTQDEGIFATFAGYDGVHVPFDDYYVMQNRTMTKVFWRDIEKQRALLRAKKGL